MKKKIAVLVATYGEVEDPTFKNLYPNSQRILRYITSRIANLPKPIQLLIAVLRSRKRKNYWGKLGYRSRLNEVTRKQADAIQAALNRLSNQGSAELEYDVREAYYFVPPYYEDVKRAVAHYDAVIVVPMIPVESEFSCGIACYITLNEFRDIAFEKVRVLKHLWNDEKLLQLYVDHLFKKLEPKLAELKGQKAGLVLSVHGTLVKDSSGEMPTINTGYKETMLFFERLKSAIERDERNVFQNIKIGAMNHQFGGEWMPETLAKALEEFKAEGIEQVVKFPYGFFADNSEADLEGIEEVKAAGYDKMIYVECINESPEFAAWLAERVRQAAERLIWAKETSMAIRQAAIA